MRPQVQGDGEYNVKDDIEGTLGSKGPAWSEVDGEMQHGNEAKGIKQDEGTDHAQQASMRTRDYSQSGQDLRQVIYRSIVCMAVVSVGREDSMLRLRNKAVLFCNAKIVYNIK